MPDPIPLHERRNDAKTYPGFTRDITRLAEQGLLEFAGDGTEDVHLTPEGLRAAQVLLAFARQPLLLFVHGAGDPVFNITAKEALDTVIGLLGVAAQEVNT